MCVHVGVGMCMCVNVCVGVHVYMCVSVCVVCGCCSTALITHTRAVPKIMGRGEARGRVCVQMEKCVLDLLSCLMCLHVLCVYTYM